MVGGTDVRIEEELPRVFVRPVFGDCEFGLAGFDGGDEVFERFVFADELEGGVGADFGDGVEVVAAEEDAEVDELFC